jgi:5'-3' exonuclease
VRPQEGPERVRDVLVAVDATGLLVRTLRSAQGVELTGPGGDPTASLMMFINSLARRLRLLQPTHAVMCWDGPRSRAWRQEIWPGYKANRPDQHHHAAEQTRQFEFGVVAGLRQIMVPGFEADDIMAAVCRAALTQHPGAQVVLVSDDQDMLQLLGPNWSGPVLVPLVGDGVTTGADVEVAWGVEPRLLPRVRALAGDASDGIPGLAGIGPKKAARMITGSPGKWPLPEGVLPDPKDRDLVVRWRDISELCTPPRYPENETGTDHFRLGETAQWDPGEAGRSIQDFLDRYGFARISDRLARGDLW